MRSMRPTASETPWAVLILGMVGLLAACGDRSRRARGRNRHGHAADGRYARSGRPTSGAGQDQVTTVISGMRLRTSGCGVAQEGPSR